MTHSSAISPSKYNPTIDTLKGCLILLVIAGHTFTEGVSGNPVKWAIYSFHMPLFLGLSGYLIDRQKLQHDSISSLVANYKTRLFLPWLLAWGAYVLLIGSPRGLGLQGVARALLQPPHHTWYVPAFLLFVGITWLCRKVNPTGLLLVSLVVGVGGMVAFRLGHHNGPLAAMPLPDGRYLTMLPFFVFGHWLRHKGLRASYVMLVPAAIGFAAYQYCYDHPQGVAEILPYLVLNLSLLSILPRLLDFRISSPVVRQMGYDSLYFYLWHPFIIHVAKATIYQRLDNRAALAATFILVIIILYVLRPVLSRAAWCRALLGIRAAR